VIETDRRLSRDKLFSVSIPGCPIFRVSRKKHIFIFFLSLSFNFSDRKRQMGNNSYRRKEYSTALQCYRNALKFLDTNENPIPNEDKQESVLIDRYIQVQNNLAQVYLLTNQYEQCLEAVNNVFRHEPKNIKALFRQARAIFELGNYDQALQPLKLLLQIQNADVDKEKVIEMLKVCETKLAQYQKNEKEIYRRMFKPTTTTTAIDEKPKIKTPKKVGILCNKFNYLNFIF
jgi:tetratricopeptide (TPR) repeat protein